MLRRLFSTPLCAIAYHGGINRHSRSLHDRAAAVVLGALRVVGIVFFVDVTPDGGDHVVAGVIAIADQAVGPVSTGD